MPRGKSTACCTTSRMPRSAPEGIARELRLRSHQSLSRAEQRIRAHVLLCWLALLLIRIAETGTGQTWPTIREELQRLHLGTFTGPAGSFRQRSELSPAHGKILAALALPEPRRIHEAIAPAGRAAVLAEASAAAQRRRAAVGRPGQRPPHDRGGVGSRRAAPHRRAAARGRSARGVPRRG
jgi:hypothetical protein